jgi:hypothetical protein
MPILGTIASSISGNLYSAAYDSIATATVGAGGVASVTFSSIPQTYKHLQIRTLVRSTGGGGSYNAIVNFNGDTTVGNYPLHYLFSSGSGVPTSGYSASDAGIAIARATGGASLANVFGVGIADIVDYTNTNKKKVVKVLLGQDDNGTSTKIQLFNSGLWTNTSAITSMTISVGGGSLAQHTSIALYGIKG